MGPPARKHSSSKNIGIIRFILYLVPYLGCFIVATKWMIQVVLGKGLWGRDNFQILKSVESTNLSQQPEDVYQSLPSSPSYLEEMKSVQERKVWSTSSHMCLHSELRAGLPAPNWVGSCFISVRFRRMNMAVCLREKIISGPGSEVNSSLGSQNSYCPLRWQRPRSHATCS